MAVEAGHDTIVGENGQVAGRERNREERVVRFRACMAIVVCPAFGACPAGTCGPVMAVCDVQAGDVGKRITQRCGLLRGDSPDGVVNGIGCGKRDKGRGFHNGCNDVIHRLAVAVGEENGAGLGAHRQDMRSAVVLFPASRFFMFFNGIVVVVIHRRAGGHTGLASSVHFQLIHVERRCVVLKERDCLLECVVVFAGFPVHRLAVGVGVCRQVHFGACDSQKADGIVPSQGSGFLPGEYIVGWCCHVLCAFRGRDYGFEWV